MSAAPDNAAVASGTINKPDSTKPTTQPEEQTAGEKFVSDVYGYDTKNMLTPQVQRLLYARSDIMHERPDRIDFLHAVLCHVGMPRRNTEERVFERRSGNVSMMIEAGKLWNGNQWVDQPLPYGTKPRLVMVHISSEAVRTQNRQIAVGDSMRDFLNALGLPTSGGPRGGYTMFKKQMEALAACRLSLGINAPGKVITIDAKPIKRFEAWLQHDGTQTTMWPGVLELSSEFFDTLVSHAVPLDYRALAALKHSALALDIYTWLAHRLCRVDRPTGVKVSWENLREQFGQEYGDPKDFKKEFRHSLRQVCTVYPDAKLDEVPGGLTLYSSPAPLSKTQVAFSLGESVAASNPVDNSSYPR